MKEELGAAPDSLSLSLFLSFSLFLFSSPCRLLRSLIGLKRVIINAAHFLVMKNKEFYRFYQTEPFLETVRPATYSVVSVRESV